MDPWSRWLFEAHPEAELRRWAQRLRLFRFVRAYGGHANDGDTLVAAYRYTSMAELQRELATLGITLFTHDIMPPQPLPGRSYPGDVFVAFPSLIRGSLTEQPGMQRVNGQPVFVWCSTDQVRFSVADGYDVNENCVERAERIETALIATTLERVDPPVDNKHCICPTYYRAYFG